MPPQAARTSAVRVLIVKTSSMGDVVHALPLAADVAQARPKVVLDWLVEEGFAAIPAMNHHVAQVHAVALRRWRKQPFSAETRNEVSAVKETLRAAKYDLVLDAQGLIKSAWIARWAGAPVAGFSAHTARERLAARFYAQRHEVPRALHAVERCRHLAGAAFGYSPVGPPRFALVRNAARAIEVAGDRYAVLLTNASRASKLWPAERWLALEQWLAQRGLTSVLFWGSDEEGARTLALAEQMQRAVLAPRSSLDAIAASLAGADLVIGLDTGLAHLAAALGRPTVGIYCDYDPRLTGLVGEGPVASVGGVKAAPASEEVIAAATRVLESR
jgi:heptosyltransferase I